MRHLLRCVSSVTVRVSVVLGLCVVCAPAVAQKVPAPSREVFRCEVGGKVTYSDAPCLGAKKVDVEPTRGMTSTGKERAGADVQQERLNEAMAEAIRPLTGKDAKQLRTDAKRRRLSASAQRECGALDASIPDAERRELQAGVEARPMIQRELLGARQRFIQLGC